MPTVTLDRLWVHNGDDLSDYLELPWREASAPVAVRGETRVYAGGRRRSVRRPGSDQQATYLLPYVSQTNREQLEAWCGTLVMVRDSRGRKLWGQYWSVEVTEWRNPRVADVRITVEKITYDEGV